MRIRAGKSSIGDEKSSTSEGKSLISARKLAISARVALGTVTRSGHEERPPKVDGACCEDRMPGNHAR